MIHPYFLTSLLTSIITFFCAFAVTNVFASHNIEEITITEKALPQNKLITVKNAAPVTDAGELLKTLPGANINRNGAITGIAQYRGLFGDRVAIHIDKVPTLTGGPNTMDSPLSYVSPLLLDSITLYRGIAPVSTAQESLGGSLSATLNRGEFYPLHNWDIENTISSLYNNNGDGQHHALRSTLANKAHKITLLAAYDEGNNSTAANNEEIQSTHFQRQRYDISYGFMQANTIAEFYIGQLSTKDTGTVALPMDIVSIDTNIAGFNFSTKIKEVGITANLGYHNVYHEMDNFSFRKPPATTMRLRLTEATGRNYSWKLAANSEWHQIKLQAGIDGNITTHTATVINPANSAFSIGNFNHSERDIYGLYVEAETTLNHWLISGGLRFNRVNMSTDNVSADGLTGMMAMAANSLAQRFNSIDQSETYNNVDWVVNADYYFTDNLVLLLGLAQKNRAPSYQERYLWLPMASTGGLADGLNYVSNTDLDSEQAHELLIGFKWQNNNFQLEPQFFYKRIDDYIQGIPAADMTANMLSIMMSGLPALMFDNVDAELVGFDVFWEYRINDVWSLNGTASYVEGKHRGTSDDLYRIAPVNNRTSLIWDQHKTRYELESVFYGAQNKVATYNNEQSTSGYGLLNLHVRYQVTSTLNLNASIGNIFDKDWQDHLGGYNQNGDNQIPIGERLPGQARNLQLGFNWTL